MNIVVYLLPQYVLIKQCHLPILIWGEVQEPVEAVLTFHWNEENYFALKTVPGVVSLAKCWGSCLA